MANIDYSIVLGTDDDDSIYNDSYGSTIDAGDGNDTIQNIGANVSIGGGRDNDSIYSWRGSYCTIDGGDDNDIIRNGISNMSINGGNGDDSIYIEYDVDKVTISGGKGNDYITSNGSKVLFQYNYGDGRNIIYGFEADSTLSISGGSYSTTKNGEDVIVHVGDGQVILNQVADLKKINIVAKEVMENSWTLNEPAAIYGTNNNTLIKVTGIKSLDGLSLNENSKVVTVAKSSLSDSKVTISDGYTLKLADDVPKSKTTKATWSLNGSTAIYKSSSKTAGYTLAKDGKSVSYTKATTAKNLATITGAKSTNGLTLSGNKITLKNSALKNKVTIGGGYEFNFASDYKKATITGSKNADTITANGNNLSINGGAGDDTIKFFGTATTVKGGTGKDLFVYKSGKNVIADYAAEDKISIAGTAKVTTSGSDVIFIVGSNKLTVKGGKGKNITYVDAGGEQVYPEQNNDVIINGKAITLTEDYLEDSFNVADYGKTLQTIDASAVQLDLSITGNKLMNSIVGGKGNDTLNGGGSNDTLTGGAGSDVFLYNTGDGNDVITDYTEDDIIHIAKGTAKIEKKGKDVIFKVGTGKITLKGAADKVVTYIDAKGKTNYYPKPTSDSIIINGTAVTVLEEYKSDTFDVGNVKNGNRVKKIDASPVSRDLKIIGNSLANVMLGGAGDDSIWGGKGNDTLQGGDGSDVFVYSNGDGKDIILDYEEDDTIKITKGTAKVTTKGSDVIFTIGSGKITVLGAADKTVSYIDANGNKKTYGSTASFLEDDTNYELTPRNDLSSIVQSKAADYSFLNTSTKLSKETNLIAYSDKK